MNQLLTMLISVMAYLHPTPAPAPTPPAPAPIVVASDVSASKLQGDPVPVPTVTTTAPDGLGGTVAVTGPSQMSCLQLAVDGYWYRSSVPGGVVSAMPGTFRSCEPIDADTGA
jgi:hypothetical protein